MTDVMLEQGMVVFLVEDEPVTREIIRGMIESDGVVLIEAATLAEAIELLDNNNTVDIDVVLLDRRLPDGDGLDILRYMQRKDALKHIPVIIQTASVAAEQVNEGLREGAYHYLTKPFSRTLLRTLVRVAARDSREMRSLMDELAQSANGLVFLKKAEFEARSVGDVRILAPYLAQFFPEPESALGGILELLINAIEHGNLEIGLAGKGGLLETDGWASEIRKRLAQPKYRNRKVRATIERQDDRVVLEISDDGQGFDWRPYLAVDETRMAALNGRGIAVARLYSFDGLEYLGAGNVVRCWSHLD